VTGCVCPHVLPLQHFWYVAVSKINVLLLNRILYDPLFWR
jgi:hypothetical protein